MNIRVLIGIGVIALGLSVMELSCMTHDDPVAAHRSTDPTETRDDASGSQVDVEVSASPVLTR